MASITRLPRNVTLYEAVRTQPGALSRLSSAGVSPEYFDYRLCDAARALHIPVERLTALIAAQPDDGSAPQ
jgi:hypothetical protein